MAVGFQQHDLALLLLLTHGIGKASIFLSFGSVILTTNNQDVREMGGLARSMPATTLAYTVGALGLVGLLPLGTFWVMFRWMCEADLPDWTVALALVVNALSALNLMRVYGLVFAGDRTLKTRRAPEMPWPMAVPMIALAIMNLLVPLIMERWQLSLSYSIANAESHDRAAFWNITAGSLPPSSPCTPSRRCGGSRRWHRCRCSSSRPAKG